MPGQRENYSGPGSLVTSLESLDQALPEAIGVSAFLFLSQYPLVKPHRKTPFSTPQLCVHTSDESPSRRTARPWVQALPKGTAIEKTQVTQLD